MPRHPPNAQKNKQQRHTNKTRNTLSQKSYSKMLASTIQFTTNPPTPTHNPQQPGAPDRSGNQGALPQNPDSMPPPHTQGHPPPADHHDHNSPSSPPQRACLSCQHQTTNHPAHQCTTVGHPAFHQEQPRPAQTHTTVRAKSTARKPPPQSILRKEVIQPHLPVRLPCYDFVPITSPTFDRSP